MLRAEFGDWRVKLLILRLLQFALCGIWSRTLMSRLCLLLPPSDNGTTGVPQHREGAATTAGFIAHVYEGSVQYWGSSWERHEHTNKP